MIDDEDAHHEQNFGSDAEDKVSKTRKNDDANEAPKQINLTPKVEDDTR